MNEDGGAASRVTKAESFDYPALRDKWYREGWFSRRTCVDAFAARAAEHPRVPVTFVTGDMVATFSVGELSEGAVTLAAALQHLGVRSGDAVAVQLTNRAECAVAYQAVLRCGAVLVPIVHIYGVVEVSYILAESGASVLITADRFGSINYLDRLDRYRETPTLRHVIVVDAEPRPGRLYLSWSQLAATSGAYRRPTADADDVCLLLYTSGTTSAPKGVQHSHNSILAEQRTMPTLIAGASDDVSLVTFPPGHIAGVMSMFRPMLSGSRAVFMDAWDPARAVRLIHRFGVTSTAGAPIHLQGILDLGDMQERLATLREFLVGAAPVAEELGRRAAAAGIQTFRSYGATEHPTVTGEHHGESEWARLRTDGKPLPGSTVRILGSDGREVAAGTDGEVVVQGPDQFVGYRDSSLNEEAFTMDGWLRTGDLGHLDEEGRLTITDRIKDVVIRGGETMSSSQIEQVLCAHPAVAEGAVVAAPDSRYGEIVAAVVSLRPNATLDMSDLREHFAASGLAKQKTPQRLVVVEALPRTPLGKVKKAELRQTHFR